MAEITGIYDGGVTKDPRGRTVGVIRFMVTTNEGKPEELVGHCHPNYRDGIIKNLKRLAWQKAGTTTETAKPDEETANP